MIEVSLDDAKRLVLDVQGFRTDNPCKSVVGVSHRISSIPLNEDAS